MTKTLTGDQAGSCDGVHIRISIQTFWLGEFVGVAATAYDTPGWAVLLGLSMLVLWSITWMVDDWVEEMPQYEPWP